MYHQVIYLSLGWIIIVLCSFGWGYYNSREKDEQNILKVSRAFFDQIVITREWNAYHGGVYVYADTKTPPSKKVVTAARIRLTNYSFVIFLSL